MNDEYGSFMNDGFERKKDGTQAAPHRAGRTRSRRSRRACRPAMKGGQIESLTRTRGFVHRYARAKRQSASRTASRARERLQSAMR
eukprot:1462342-Pleurochrysis_carterae.AAC.1